MKKLSIQKKHPMAAVLLGVLFAWTALGAVPAWAQFDNTNVLVQDAVNHMYQKRYKEAFKVLQGAYEQSPRHPGVHYNMARLYEITGNIADALKEYQLAAVLDPSLVSARRGIARCSVELKRSQQTSYGPPPERMPSALSPVARPAAPVVTQGDDAPQQPAYELPRVPVLPETARQPQAYAYNPPRPTSYPMPAQAPVKLIPLPDESDPAPSQAAVALPSMPGSAELPSMEAIKVPPLPTDVSQKIQARSKTDIQAKAEALLDRGDAGRAIDLIQGSEPDSDNPDIHFLLGKAFGMKGDLFSAIKHLEEAIRVDENFHASYYLLAQYYSKVNLLDDAIKNYLKYFAVKPQAGVAVEIARTYERMGKLDQAQEFYAKANAMNPGNPNLQGRLEKSSGKVANDIFMRANQALTTGDYQGAVALFQQALSVPGLDPSFQKDARRKLEVAKLRQSEVNRVEQPARQGFVETRKNYGTVNLKFSQFADIAFQTNFKDPITVEWRGYVARSFRRYGRDFLLMIKELSQDELDDMGRDRNDYRLNPNYNNQPVFLLTAKQGGFPPFVREGALITFTGQTDWKRYDIINELGQTVKLPAFDFVSGHP